MSKVENPGPILSRRALGAMATGAFAAALGATPAMPWIRQHQNRDYAFLAEFLGEGYDPDRHDASSALAAGARWSSSTGKALIIEGDVRLDGTTTIANVPNARIRFEDCTLKIGDRGRPARISNGALGPIGLHFQDSPGLALSGQAALKGLGRAGQTGLAGVVIDRCARSAVEATLTFERMAAGLMLLWSDDAYIANLTSTDMDGRQTFGDGTAGSTLVISGSARFEVGSVTGLRTRKPVVYLSVAPDSEGRRTDNADGRIGNISGTGLPGSQESCVLAIRSGRRCHIEKVSGEATSMGLYVVRYAGDEGYSVDGNRVGRVEGAFPATSASVDAAVVQEVEEPGLSMGTNHVDAIDVRCDGEFGVLVSAGEMTFGSIAVRGGVRPLVVRDAHVSADTVVLSNQNQEAIGLGRGASLHVNRASILTGSSGGVSGAIRYMPELGGHGRLGRVRFDHIEYAQNGVGRDVLWVYFDYSGENTRSSVSFGEIRGSGSRGATYFAGL